MPGTFSNLNHAKSIRVLFVTGSYPLVRCGVGDYVKALSDNLAREEGLIVGVLTGSVSSEVQPCQGVELLPLIDKWTLSNLMTVLRVVRNWRPDIVHIQYPTKGYGTGKMPILLPLLLGYMGMKVVQTWHEPLTPARCLRYLLCAVTRDALVVVEPDYLSFVPQWFGRLLERKKLFRFIPVASNIPRVALADAERNVMRAEFDASSRNLVAYFGFAIPDKGIETILEIADPDQDRLLLICELSESDPYHRELLHRFENGDWKGKVFVTGYRQAEDVAKLLAAADVALFPFLKGATSRNASVLAARAQGTFVLTTSAKRKGYSSAEHVFYAAPGNVQGMREGLRFRPDQTDLDNVIGPAGWREIAEMHCQLYRELQEMEKPS